MRPMSLWESGESTGEVSISELFKGNVNQEGFNKLKLEDIAFLVCRGGWPSATTKNTRVALRQAYDYYDAVVKTDISRVDEISRNSERTKLLLRSYARSQGGQVSIGAIRQDMMEMMMRRWQTRLFRVTSVRSKNLRHRGHACLESEPSQQDSHPFG